MCEVKENMKGCVGEFELSEKELEELKRDIEDAKHGITFEELIKEFIKRKISGKEIYICKKCGKVYDLPWKCECGSEVFIIKSIDDLLPEG